MKLSGPAISVAVALLTALAVGSWIIGFWDSPPAPVTPPSTFTYHPPPSAPHPPEPPLPPPMPGTLESLHTTPPPTPTPADTASPAPNSSALAIAAEKQAAMDTVKAREEQDLAEAAQAKAMTNNLRQLAAASQQYMLDKGVTQASYNDVVGTSTDSYIRSITPVAGENYQDMTINQSTTQITISTPDGRTVTYNL